MCVLFRLSRVVVSQEKFPREVPAYRPTLFLLYSLPSPWLDREPNQERHGLSVTTSYPFAELTTFLGPSRGLFGRKYNQRDQLNKAKWSASFKTAQLSQFRSISYPSAATYIHTFQHKYKPQYAPRSPVFPYAPRHHFLQSFFLCSKASFPPVKRSLQWRQNLGPNSSLPNFMSLICCQSSPLYHSRWQVYSINLYFFVSETLVGQGGARAIRSLSNLLGIGRIIFLVVAFRFLLNLRICGQFIRLIRQFTSKMLLRWIYRPIFAGGGGK